MGAGGWAGRLPATGRGANEGGGAGVALEAIKMGIGAGGIPFCGAGAAAGKSKPGKPWAEVVAQAAELGGVGGRGGGEPGGEVGKLRPAARGSGIGYDPLSGPAEYGPNIARIGRGGRGNGLCGGRGGNPQV